MEKVIGFVLLVAAGVVIFYAVTHFDRLTSITLPVSEKIIKYFKVDAFKQ